MLPHWFRTGQRIKNFFLGRGAGRVEEEVPHIQYITHIQTHTFLLTFAFSLKKTMNNKAYVQYIYTHDGILLSQNLPFATTWMGFEGITQSEINQI